MKVWNDLLRVSIGLLGVLLVGNVALAQVSPSHDLGGGAFTGGGGARSSAAHTLQDAQLPLTGVSTSAGVIIQSGFMAGIAAPGDPSQPDAACADAHHMATDGSEQNRTFATSGATHWFRFTAQANQTYIIEVENTGPQADAVLFLFDTCATSPTTSDNNAFGTTVRLAWDSTKNGDYFIRVQQFDPNFFGPETSFRMRIMRDTTPPSAPTNLRCVSINATTIGVQWQRSPERDVTRYRINFRNQSGTFSGSEDVSGATTTYYELDGLTTDQTYRLHTRALDFSGNESQQSGEVQCVARAPEDPTIPTLNVQQPTSSNVYSTTADTLTFSGQVADAGNNLSRVQVRNTNNGQERWDYSLDGGSSTFRVEDMPIGAGDNVIRLTVFDAAGNSAEQSVIVRRVGGGSPGAAIIVAGHNETFGLQTNIYNSTNRAYRIFRSAGFSDDDIYYIAPVAQDANNDGTDNVDQLATPAAVQHAITTWAKEKVGPDKPLFVYLMDHGLENKYCVNGCADGNSITPQQVDDWLRELEEASGVSEVNVFIEACVSGSFIDRKDVTDSISKLGRVIITSTGFNNNAYASAQGAYFSDAFFSCLADSGSLKACFDEGQAAVQATGVNQTPFLDDNGDGSFGSGDGAIADQRYVTRFFSSIRPTITTVNVARENNDGVLTASITEGAEAVTLVWAAIYPPTFTEPQDVTLNLNVPVVRLEPVDGQPGQWQVDYPNGFLEEGDYRIIFYAQDRIGIHAAPRQEGDAPRGAHDLYVPEVHN